MKIRATVIAAGLSLSASAALAADDCTHVGVSDFFDLEEDAVVAVYDCLKDKMAAGYAKAGDPIASEYRGWAVTATRAAVAGPHGNRLLLTFANDIAAEQYLKFEDEGVEMPVGSILAKESVSLSKKKQTARPGPLFLMTKMEEGSIPETDDWLYGGIQPNGKPMKFKQAFCHDCHSGWADSDHLAYPLEDVRVGGDG